MKNTRSDQLNISLLVIAIFFGLPTAMRADLNSGLAAYYQLDGNANDASGNGLNGTLMNSPSFTNGVTGDAVYLTGSGEYGANGQYVQLPSIPLTNYTAFTIALWAKIDGQTVPDGEDLISFGSQGDNWSGVVSIRYFGNSPTGMAFIAEGGGVYLSPVPTNCANNWAHYALTFDNGTLTAFINGQSVGSVANVTPSLYGTTAGLGIHWWHNSPYGVSTRFIGAIDEVRIYNRALSDAEMMQLVPEPATWSLLVVGAVALLGGLRLRRR